MFYLHVIMYDLIVGKLICLQCMLEHDGCEQGGQIFK